MNKHDACNTYNQKSAKKCTKEVQNQYDEENKMCWKLGKNNDKLTRLGENNDKNEVYPPNLKRFWGKTTHYLRSLWQIMQLQVY